MAEPLTISISDDTFWLLLHVTSKTVVRLPIHEPMSLNVLRDITRARTEVSHAIISTPAAPTQRQVDDLIKAYKAGGGKITKGLVNAPSDLSLEMLGL